LYLLKTHCEYCLRQRLGRECSFRNVAISLWIVTVLVIANIIVNICSFVLDLLASDGIACRILINNEQLEQVDTFSYLGFLITEDGECTTEFRTWLNRGRQSGHHYKKYEKDTAYQFQRRYD